MKKLLTVLGARPQFVKAGVVSAAINDTAGLSEVLVHTGQHYDDNMSEIFFREFGLPAPSHHLGIGSGSHGEQTGRMLIELERVVQNEAPDGVMVYGDTNSTLAGAIVASKLTLPLIHVEAGLRSFNRSMPEEINRIVTDAVSTLLLPPTKIAADHLKHEGVPDEKVLITGDVMFDAVLRANASAKPPKIAQPYFLATVHRAENTDDPERLAWILDVMTKLSKDIPVVLPLHPRTRAALAGSGLESRAAALKLIEPVGYSEIIGLIGNAQAVLTDSGGLQKEAFFLDKPVHVFRGETEWTELIETGWAQLLPPGGDPMIAVNSIRDRGSVRGNHCDAYGDGTAALKVADAALLHLTNA